MLQLETEQAGPSPSNAETPKQVVKEMEKTERGKMFFQKITNGALSLSLKF